MHVLRIYRFSSTHRKIQQINDDRWIYAAAIEGEVAVFLKSIWSLRLIFRSRVPASLRGSQSGLTRRYRWRRKIDSMPVLGKPMRTISMKRVGLSRLVTHTLPAFAAMCMHTGCSRALRPSDVIEPWALVAWWREEAPLPWQLASTITYDRANIRPQLSSIAPCQTCTPWQTSLSSPRARYALTTAYIHECVYSSSRRRHWTLPAGAGTTGIILASELDITFSDDRLKDNLKGDDLGIYRNKADRSKETENWYLFLGNYSAAMKWYQRFGRDKRIYPTYIISPFCVHI